MTTTAYSYIRFSSIGQQAGDSFRRQLDLSEQYVKEHGLKLNTSLNMHDLGVSAFDGSNLEKGALGAFVEAVRTGRVEQGSFLLVESLDRISRAQVLTALQLFISILNAGIVIVTLADSQTYSATSVRDNPYQLLISIVVMARAHEESLTKSKRISAAWAKKRENASSNVLTKTCPNWLQSTESGFVEIPEHVAIVQRIFSMKANGMGKLTISKCFNLEGVPLISRRKTSGLNTSWHQNTIAQILRSRSVLGELQPHSGRGDDRRPVGDPIPGYYPRIVNDELWALSRPNENKSRSGRNASQMVSIFRGLLRCAHCGGTVTTLGHSRNGVFRRQIGCYDHQRGVCSESGKWEYHSFLQRFVETINEVDLESLIDHGKDDPCGPLRARVAAITSKLVDVESMIENLLVLVESGQLATVAERLAKRESEKASFLEELRQAKSKLSEAESFRNNLERNVSEIRVTLRALNDSASSALRIKANKHLHTVISRIVVHLGMPNMAHVQFKEDLYSTVMLADPIKLQNGTVIGSVVGNFEPGDFPGKFYQDLMRTLPVLEKQLVLQEA